MKAHPLLVFMADTSVVVGGIENPTIWFRLVAAVDPLAAGVISVDLAKFAGLISCLEAASNTLLSTESGYFIDGFHLANEKGGGAGLSVLVNEVKLNNILGLYDRIGGNSLIKVLLKFFTQDWDHPMKRRSRPPVSLSMDQDDGSVVKFTINKGVEYCRDSDG